MLKDISKELLKSATSVLPIFFLVIILNLIGFINFHLNEILDFSLATFFIIIGIGLFSYGAEVAMTPIGQTIGRGLSKQGNLKILYVAVFIFAFLITVSEPDLSVLASQTSSVFPAWLLIFSISLAVGTFMLFGAFKIIHKVNLVNMLSIFYMLVFAIATLVLESGKSDMIGLSFDAGGVTTGPMTVPFIMALGSGISAVLARKSEKDASFGFVAFSSVGPVMVLLLLTLFSKGQMNYQFESHASEGSFIYNFFSVFLTNSIKIGFSLLLIYLSFILVNVLFLNKHSSKGFELIKGMLFAYVGLLFFLTSAEVSYMDVGTRIGEQLSLVNVDYVVMIAFIIGAITVIAEPAIQILVEQVEKTTNGLIKKRSLLIALAIGCAIAIGLAVIRINYSFSILYIIIPGYILCFLLSFFVPKIYTAIAFDAGGVASGPLTSSFILPIMLGFCLSKNGEASLLQLGFGIVAMVALSPLISIEVLGLISLIKRKVRVNSEVKKVLRRDCNMIIPFTGSKQTALEKLYLMVIALPKGKKDIILDMLSSYNVTMSFNTLARGSFDRNLTKDVMFCVIREDTIKDAILAIEDKFSDFNSKISMVYAVPIDSLAGVSNYMILADGGMK